jgi:hypothetical protein
MLQSAALLNCSCFLTPDDILNVLTSLVIHSFTSLQEDEKMNTLFIGIM